MCFWESLVITHMLPSNADHKEFFSASSISAGLVDDEMERIRPYGTKILTSTKLCSIENGGVIVEDKATGEQTKIPADRVVLVQVSQETGERQAGEIPICLRSFQFVVIHTVEGFGVVNKAEVDVRAVLHFVLVCVYDIHSSK